MPTTEVSIVRDIRDRLAAQYGTEFKRIEPLIRRITVEKVSLGALVREYGISHRTVVDVIEANRHYLDVSADGVTVKEQCKAFYEQVYTQAATFDYRNIFEELLPLDQHTGLVSELKDIYRLIPRGDKNLDHVSAVVETCVRRALLLSTLYDMSRSAVLFLGDHDMTSIALLKLLGGRVNSVSVVDIDERLLAFIDSVAKANGWDLTTYFADLRLGLPSNLVARYDLVFSDPPYTDAGMALFMQRGIEALKRSGFPRLLLCYGFGEQLPTLGYKVQQEMTHLKLVTEAIIPYFNHYDGAEAIGSRSSLYICRPTPRTWKVVAGRSMDEQPKIYTQGMHATDSLHDSDSGTCSALQEIVDEHSGEVDLIGFDAATARSLQVKENAIGMRRFVATQIDVKRRAGKGPDAAVISLVPHYERYFLRSLLLCDYEVVYGVISSRQFQMARRTPESLLVGAKFEVALHKQMDEVSIVAARKTPVPSPKEQPVQYVLRAIVDQRKALLKNSLLRAIVTLGEGRLTKNEVRGLLSAFPTLTKYADTTLSAVPAHALSALIEEVQELVRSMQDGNLGRAIGAN